MYQEIIDNLISARDAERQEERGSDAGEWHPSGLFGCERQAVYSYTGEPVSDQKDIRSIRIMDRGTQMHEEVQAALVTHYPGTLCEVKVDFGGVKGSCDALVPESDGFDNKELGYQTVYELQELKSISPNGKRWLKGDPKPDHAEQARTYYWALERMGYLLSGIIRIVYMDRDDYSTLEFEIEPWDVDEVAKFEAKLAKLDNHVFEGTLPERMSDDYWLCKYCEYFTTCKGGR